MIDPSHPIAELLRKDNRYAFDAYVFIFEALNFAQNVLQMGEAAPPESNDENVENQQDADDRQEPVQHHVTGQQLCEAVRKYALEQYGYMAKDVLASWGIHKTDDFGQIVFNLIRIEQMRKTPHDRIEDFHDVYDFDKAFRQGFKITPPGKKA